MVLVMEARPTICSGPHNCRCGASMSPVMVTGCPGGSLGGPGTPRKSGFEAMVHGDGIFWDNVWINAAYKP